MEKRVTIKDVAKEAGVSTATVSNVINNIEKASYKTKQKVMKAIERLNYQPDLSARSLVKRKSRLIGVMLPIVGTGNQILPTRLLANPFYSTFLTGLEYEARKNGYEILLTGCKDEKAVVDIVHQRNLDGIIYLGMYPQKVYEYMKQLHIPVALIDTYDNVEFFHNIAIDDELGGYMATRYLIEMGHRSIGILCGDISVPGVMQKRYEGYRRALREAAIEEQEGWRLETDISFEGGYNQTINVIPLLGQVTAMFTSADIIAFGLIKGLRQHYISVPHELSIIGFDDLEGCEHVYPTLTTVRQNIFAKGSKAAELVIQEIEEGYKPQKATTLLPLEIIERESVKDQSNEKISIYQESV